MQYICEFKDGNQRLALLSNILMGKVYNNYSRNFNGVGYMGDTYELFKNDKNYKTIYTRWKGMIRRCYSDGEPTYKNTYVCERWHNFSNYIEDIQDLIGYDKFVEMPNVMFDIDKDILGDSTVYSKETCCFVPKIINTLVSRRPSNNTSGFKDVIYDSERGLWKCANVHKGELTQKRFSSKKDAIIESFNVMRKSLEIYLEDFDWLDERVKCGARDRLERTINESKLESNINLGSDI